MSSKSIFKRILFLFIIFVFASQFSWRFDKEIMTIKNAISKNKSLETTNAQGITPLARAAQQGNLEVVKLLLDNKANINTKTSNVTDTILEAGNTALHFACLYGRLEVIELLVDYKADIFAVNHNGNNAAYLIVNSDMPGYKMIQALQVLFKRSTPSEIKKILNMKNKQGYTFLMRAVERKNNAEILLKHFGKYFDFSLKNKEGKTAYEIVESVDDSIADMLIEVEQKQKI